MTATIWQGVVSAPVIGTDSVSFSIDPVTRAVTQVTSGGPLTFTPAAGYAWLSGMLTSSVSFPPGSQPPDPAAAWAAAAAQLMTLVPGKTYTLTITEN